MNQKKSYTPSLFDLAFINAIEYLIKHRKEHNLFRTAKELLAELDIIDANYFSIRSNLRGVTKDKIPEIIHILVNRYGVNEEYLRTKKGNIMSKPITQEQKKVMGYDDLLAQFEKNSKELNETLNELHDTKLMLYTLQKVVDKMYEKL